MRTIDRHELEQLLNAAQPVRLIMALGPAGFARAHIPGSETFADVEHALDALDPDDDIVVYCSGPACQASAWAARILDSRGYRHVRRFVGGLEEWYAAGLPLVEASGRAPITA